MSLRRRGLTLAVSFSLFVLVGVGCTGASPVPIETPAVDTTGFAQRDPNVPTLPFPDNPDPSACGIPAVWGAYPGWVIGVYQGQLVEPTVLLYDSHARNHITGELPSGTEVRIELYQANPVLDFYYVRAETPAGPQKGWVPGPFLRLSPPTS